MPVFEIKITLKEGIVDPEGENTRKTLQLLGYRDISQVTFSKLYTVSIEGGGEGADKEVEEICRRLLANPAIHNYSYRMIDAS